MNSSPFLFMRSKKNFKILFEPIIGCVCTCFPLFQTETSKSKIVLSAINIKVICVYTTWHNLTFVSERVQYYLGKCLNGLYLIGCRNSDFDKFHSNAISDVVSYVVTLLVLKIIVLWYPHIFLKIGRNKYADLLKIRALQITITCFGEGHREVSKLYTEMSSTSAWLTCECKINI